MASPTMRRLQKTEGIEQPMAAETPREQPPAGGKMIDSCLGFKGWTPGAGRSLGPQPTPPSLEEGEPGGQRHRGPDGG